MNQTARRAAALTAAAGLLTVAALANSGTATATAGDTVLRLSAHDQVAAPGTAPRLDPVVESGTADGKTVIAFSTKALTGPAGEGAGVPEGFTAQANGCSEVSGLVAVYVCGPSGLRPGFTVPKDATDMTAVHWGFAHVPRGGDLAAGIQTARTAAAVPAGPTHGSAKVVVKTAAHAASNTARFDVPGIPSGGTVRQQLRFHAQDAGELFLRFRPADGYLWHGTGPIRIGGITTSAGAVCTLTSAVLLSTPANLQCRLEPGDHTIGYDLSTSAGQYTARLQALTSYDIHDFSTPTSDIRHASTPFTALGKPVLPRHGLLARDTTGTLFQQFGAPGTAAAFYDRAPVGSNWQAYTALTALSPLKELPYSFTEAKPSAATRGHGDLITRDASGTLWYYDRQNSDDTPYATRVRIGPGWNAYDRITGAGDLDRDGFADLVARDKSGILWFYGGTGRLTDNNRLKARVRVGGGWQAYDRLAGGADLSGDGRADLLARDKAGILWLYKGTGSATVPYATRIRIGGGWQVYDQLVVTGDLTDDGRPDAVARDKTGTLWLYKGTGSATAPFATRTPVGGGWNTYNQLF
ncbi:FG-GAP repeat domain-containing protein [Streptomyces sp. NPDC090056]|uniref:FG-GAP repeat domain-containing protein n=1 Tax=Streptomyces sp. NPDC090056 TaxID=3365934 RepID=UPI0037F39175